MNPEDVKSVESIVHALYELISGPVGKVRDWDRIRSLYHPGARLIPTGQRPVEDQQTGARILTVEDWIKTAEPYFQKTDFYEIEVASRQERFGNIAHVFSTYESKHALNEAPFQRGINSIQLYHDGARWWIVTVFWDNETPQKPIPQKYL